MRRVTVADIMRETGLSRATIDRVLNGRAKVHDRTRAVVEDTVARLRAGGTPAPKPPVADIALRVGRGMMQQMRAAWSASGVQGALHDLHMADEAAVLRCVETLCKDVSRPLILTAKNSDRLVAVLANARAKGKRIVALVSDLPPVARDGFVGLDDRAAGQTAAFLIGRMLGDRPTTVGVVLGNIAFRCHEDREIGFRTGLRAHFPKVVISGEAQGEDSSQLTRNAVSRLLTDNPALGAIYNVGGGNAGMVEALRAAGRVSDMLVIGHEANPATVPLLRAGAMDFSIAGSPTDLLEAAVQMAAGVGQMAAGAGQIGQGAQLRHIDFGVYSRFNLPSFSNA